MSKVKTKRIFSGDSNTDKIQQEERCYLNTKLPNCCFNPNHETPLNLQRYISIVKKEIIELLKKPNYQQSNLTSDERLKLRYLSENRNLTIKGADKGGKIVIMDTAEYIEHCELLLNDREFYEKLHADPTLIYTKEIKQKIDGMLKNKYITKQEYNYLSENLENQRTPLFYGLPKIHKIFDSFPPLRPIVSGFNFCTCNLSKFVDSFLKFQAQQCKSYIRDTKDFLMKLSLIKNIPENSSLVTMDVSSLYTNINHEEDAEACFKKLEERKNKSIPSIVIKNLTFVIPKSNAFRFGNEYYRQITGITVGTPMAPNYANLFMDNFEQNLMRDYSQETGLSPLVWFPFIDDIFFIWTVNKDSLDHFISFTQNYSKSRNIKSKIKFEIHLSTNEVHFLDVTVSLNHGKLTTTLFTKPTESHFYLNTSSCHPSHVVKNISKGQFIRLRRICSRKSDYLLSSEILCKKFIERGFHEKELKKTVKQVAKMDRNELLQDRIRENKDPHTILVSTWHPKLSAIPSILKNNFHLISSDPKLSKIFKQKSTVT